MAKNLTNLSLSLLISLMRTSGLGVGDGSVCKDIFLTWVDDDNDSNDDNYSNDDKEGDAVSIKMMITEGRGAGRKQRINITMT